MNKKMINLKQFSEKHLNGANLALIALVVLGIVFSLFNTIFLHDNNSKNEQVEIRILSQKNSNFGQSVYIGYSDGEFYEV